MLSKRRRLHDIDDMDVNERDYCGQTKLHSLFLDKNSSLSSIVSRAVELFSLGADVTSKDYNLSTPFHFIQSWLLVDALKNCGISKYLTHITCAVYLSLRNAHGQLPVALRLCSDQDWAKNNTTDENISIEEVDFYGNTVWWFLLVNRDKLSAAGLEGQKFLSVHDEIKFGQACGADINHRNKCGKTILHLVTMRYSVFYIEFDQDIDRTFFPLDSFHRLLCCIRPFIEAGADPLIRDNLDRNFLYFLFAPQAEWHARNRRNRWHQFYYTMITDSQINEFYRLISENILEEFPEALQESTRCEKAALTMKQLNQLCYFRKTDFYLHLRQSLQEIACEKQIASILSSDNIKQFVEIEEKRNKPVYLEWKRYIDYVISTRSKNLNNLHLLHYLLTVCRALMDVDSLLTNLDHPLMSDKTDQLALAVQQIPSVVDDFIHRLAAHMSGKNKELSCKAFRVGSIEEGTKLDLPDEFDYNFELLGFGQNVDVVPSNRSTCFVSLLLRSLNVSTLTAVDDYFDNEDYLLGRRVFHRFQAVVEEALSDKEFMQNQVFVSVCESSYISQKSEYEQKYKKTIVNSKFTLTLKLRLCSLHRCNIPFIVSVDITPCITCNGWQPVRGSPCKSGEKFYNYQEQTKNKSADLGNSLSTPQSMAASDDKDVRCHLVFDRPYRYHRWLGEDKPLVRISFSAEQSEKIKWSPSIVKTAYLLAKRCVKSLNLLVNKYDNKRLVSSHVLKQSLLHHLGHYEHSDSVVSSMSQDSNISEIRLWLHRIFRGVLYFAFIDHPPEYFASWLSYHKCIHHFALSHKEILSRYILYWITCSSDESLRIYYPEVLKKLAQFDEDFACKELHEIFKHKDLVGLDLEEVISYRYSMKNVLESIIPT